MKNQLFQLFVFFFVIFATHEISFALPIDPALPSGEYASSSLIINTRAHCDMVDTVTKKEPLFIGVNVLQAKKAE